MEDDELLDGDAACAYIGGTRPIHITSLYRGVKDRRYSPPIKLGPHTSRWRKSELRGDIERFAAQRESVAVGTLSPAPHAPAPKSEKSMVGHNGGPALDDAPARLKKLKLKPRITKPTRTQRRRA